MKGLSTAGRKDRMLGKDLKGKDREARGECTRVEVMVDTVHFQAHWRQLEKCTRRASGIQGILKLSPTGPKLILDPQMLGSQPFPQRAMSSSLRYIRALQKRQ